ncbi:MAG: endolytic transglycosylase MltG [Wenzhouxiangellaceae bacterium]
MIRKLLIFLLIVLIVSAVFGAAAWRDYRQFADQPMAAGGTAVVWVRPGDSLGAVVERLERLGLASVGWQWRLLGRLERPVIKAGEYRVHAGESPAELLARMDRGDVVRHRFTIVEGWNLARLRAELEHDSRIESAVAGLGPEALMQRLGCEGCFAEGWFLPETYQFVRGDRDLDLLARAHRAMQRELEQAWAQRTPDHPLETPEELLVLASLVELEAVVAEERDQVAGVFVRRLNRGMRLQTDPTVVYGITGDFDGRIRRVHLRTDHPWNTYTRGGLPPTPIALPGAAAIHAAAQPADGNALYFVARGDGTHQFSATLAEHNRAVARYILGRE